MREKIRRISIKSLIILFLVFMTIVSFKKEETRAQVNGIQADVEYSDEELNAMIVSNTAPNTVRHTEKYNIEITVKNSGKAVWSNAENIRLCIWQDALDYGFRVNIPDGIEIHSGEQWTFKLEDFVLTEVPQTKLEFQMVKENITYFGEREAVMIIAVD